MTRPARTGPDQKSIARQNIVRLRCGSIVSRLEHMARVVRVLACRYCGHRLRLGADRCGLCYRPAPLQNRRVTWLALIGALLLAGWILI